LHSNSKHYIVQINARGLLSQKENQIPTHLIFIPKPYCYRSWSWLPLTRFYLRTFCGKTFRNMRLLREMQWHCCQDARHSRS